jgi:hypothetical protein
VITSLLLVLELEGATSRWQYAEYIVTPAKAGVQDIMTHETINMLLLPGVQQKSVAPVRRREHTLSMFTKTPPHPAFAGMTAWKFFRIFL